MRAEKRVIWPPEYPRPSDCRPMASVPGTESAAASSEDRPEPPVDWANSFVSSVLWWLPGIGAPSSDTASSCDAAVTVQEPEPETCLEPEPVAVLLGQADIGPLLVVLPETPGECGKKVLAVLAVFRGSGLRGVEIEGERLEAEHALARGLASPGSVSNIVVFSVRDNAAKTCCYRGDDSDFASLSYFVASVMHTDYLLGAAPFLRSHAFVRFLCADSILEVVGPGVSKADGADANVSSARPPTALSPACRCYHAWMLDPEPPCAILVTRSATAPSWFVAASRLFAPRLRSPSSLHPVCLCACAPRSSVCACMCLRARTRTRRQLTGGTADSGLHQTQQCVGAWAFATGRSTPSLHQTPQIRTTYCSSCRPRHQPAPSTQAATLPR